jgi:mannose-1-phosphate guanylyltransferase/mannose-6-phosphate isomerase
MIPVILSGGSGSRLWPISRENYPKQFCELFDQSFLRNTYNRLKGFGDPYVVTLDSMGPLTQTSLNDLGLKKENLILEPFAKNTATAVALIVSYLKGKVSGSEVLGIFPADHLIQNEKAFNQALQLAQIQAKEGFAVTLGIQASYAATGFGYIELHNSTEIKPFPEAFKVKQFTEKPDISVAREYLHSGRHFWNAGIFLFTLDSIIKMFATHMPELWSKMQHIHTDKSNLKYIYANFKSQSMDYGIMEKTQNLVCIPGNFGWSDVGSWDEMARIREEYSELQMDSKAQIFNVSSNNNFIFTNHNKVVGLSHVNDLVIVDTPDALLVTHKGYGQEIRKLVEQMREAQVPQVSEHHFEVRPWGKFEVLSDEKTHKVKRIIVDPFQQMSYQMHLKRDEHWVVISGQAEVRIKDAKYQLLPGEQIKISRGQKHRIKNPTNLPLIFIEVQTGDYFGEDDIERFEDDYNRV